MRPTTNDLKALLVDPRRIAAIPREEAASALVALAEIHAALAARVGTPDPPQPRPPTGSRLLSAKEAAKRLAMSTRWLYAAARDGRLPFALRLSTGAVRFNEEGLERWLEKRA